LAGVSLAGFSAGSSVFLADFLGRVEESIKDKSILSSTLGDSTSGASILTVVGFSTSFSAAFTVLGFSTSFAAGLASSGSATTGFFALSLSATAFFGSSTWSALFLATLSL
jgi:hypothetical protein